MRFRGLDIGGSGVKSILLSDLNDDLKKDAVKYYKNPDWEHFTSWLHRNNLINTDIIGISCAGFIDPSGIVKMFRAGNWINKSLSSEIISHSPKAKVILLNDAEAHLMAHYDLYKNPQMCIALGTSLGFAINDKNGVIVRPLNNINFDIGQLSIPTKASNNRVWWALGSNGLKELQDSMGKNDGTRHFGYRLGTLIGNLCSVFRPQTVVFSGGITEAWWPVFQETMISEFIHEKPDWLEQPDFVKSPFSSEAALVGMAKYVRSYHRI